MMKQALGRVKKWLPWSYFEQRLAASLILGGITLKHTKN
jgi:hypothetical protein